MNDQERDQLRADIAAPQVPPGAFQAALDRDRNPRDRARDQLEAATVRTYQQMRTDQERIAELEQEIAKLQNQLAKVAWNDLAELVKIAIAQAETDD